MNLISTSSSAEFSKQIVELYLRAIDEISKQVAHMLWTALTSFLSEHWFAVLLALFVLFVIVTLKAMFGRWGSLGSFLYNFFYFGILFVIGLIWGPEVFVNDYFHAACVAILYPICYVLAGVILDKMEVRR